MTIRKLASQTAVYGLSSIVGRLLPFLLIPIYTRIFNPGEYGVVTMLYAMVAFMNILFTYGLETAYFRYAGKETQNPGVYSTALISIISTSLTLALLIVLLSPTLAGWMPGNGQSIPELPAYIRWFAWILAFDAISAIPFAKLRMENKAWRFATIRVLNIVLYVSLNLFFLVLCPWLYADNPESISFLYDPSIGIGYIFISNLIASFVTLLFLAPEIFKIKFQFDSKLWKTMVIYSLPLMVAGFAGMINETLDRVLLPMLLPDKSTALQQVGIYGACYKISILMTLFIQTFRYAAEPFFFSQAEASNAKATYARVMHFFVITCAFIFLGVMMYIDIIKYFIGEDFREGLAVVPVLLLANLCLGVFFNLSIWYKLSGKTHWGAFLAIIGAVITIAFNILLIPLMGYMGATWATLICYAGMMVMSYAIGQKYYRVNYSIPSFLFYVGLALIFYFISNIFRSIFEGNQVMILMINTILILAFITVTLIREKFKNLYLRKVQKNES